MHSEKALTRSPRTAARQIDTVAFLLKKKSGTDSLTERISVALGARVAGAARACTSS